MKFKFLPKIFQERPKGFSRLEDKLRECRGVSPSEAQRERMKRYVMSALPPAQTYEENFGFAVLIEKIKAASAQVLPAAAFRVLLKERLITLVDFNNTMIFDRVGAWLRSFRKIGALATALIFVIVVVFNFGFYAQRVEASFVTVLEEIDGEVSITRDGRLILGSPQFLLKADDVIKTGPDSKAVIRFLDQSVSRLDENTEVKIAKLFVNPSNRTETIVEIVLHEGRLWARVISLIDNISRFQVKAKNTVAVARKKAAFDVTVLDKGKSKFSAIQNRVDLVVATDKKIIETTLVKGFTAEVKTNTSVAPQIRPDEGADAKGAPDQWRVENLAKDKEYIETIKQETQAQVLSQAKVLPGNPLYAVRGLSESTTIALTLNGLEKHKKILTAAQEKLMEAEALFTKGDNVKATALLVEFQTQLGIVLQWIKDNEAPRPAEVFELKTMIFELLNVHQKQLTTMLPNDLLYSVKTAVAESQITAAAEGAEKTQEKLSVAGDKLFEVHDLAEQGDSLAAGKKLEEYSQTLSDVVIGVKQLPIDEKEKAVGVLLDNKAEDIKMLEAIAQDKTASPPAEQTLAPAAESGIAGSGTTLIGEVIPPPQTQMVEGSTTPFITLPAPAQEVIAGTTTLPADKDTASVQLNKAASAAKVETLTRLGEAVLEVQQEQSSTEVLKKLEDIRKIDVNGKQIVDVTLGRNQMFIKTDGSYINVTPPAAVVTPPTSDLKKPESPRAQP